MRGVVYECVEASEALLDGGKCAADVRDIRGIHAKAKNLTFYPLRCRFRRCRVAARYGDVPSVGGEAPRYGKPGVLRRSCYQNCLFHFSTRYSLKSLKYENAIIAAATTRSAPREAKPTSKPRTPHRCDMKPKRTGAKEPIT